jgi:predicted metal-binding membrane protein
VGLRLVTDDLRLVEGAGGVVFAMAGVYQCSPWKSAFLDRCRMRASSQRPGAETQGVAGAVWAGVSHGLA